MESAANESILISSNGSLDSTSLASIDSEFVTMFSLLLWTPSIKSPSLGLGDRFSANFFRSLNVAATESKKYEQAKGKADHKIYTWNFFKWESIENKPTSNAICDFSLLSSGPLGVFPLFFFISTTFPISELANCDTEEENELSSKLRTMV